MISHQLATPPLLYPFSTCSPTFTLSSFSSLLHIYYHFFFSPNRSISEMENALENIKRTYLNLPRDVLRLIYRYRLERSRFLIKSRLPRDIQEIIEAKIHLASELSSSFVKYLPGMGKSSYSKKRRAKRMKVCHKCAR